MIATRTVVGVFVGALMAPAIAAAQPLGTFTWQLQPFCNKVVLNVTSDGGIYTLDGFDDQCAAPRRAPLVGIATLNPDGSIGLGFSIVTVPGALPVHVDARLAPGALSGTWRDSAGNSGPFAFSGSAAGAPRPAPTLSGVILSPGTVTTATIADGTVGTADVNPAEVQRRVSGVCGPGLFFTAISDAGVPACADGAPGGLGAVSLGTNALAAVTTGNSNTAVGDHALPAVTTGSRNVALGSRALLSAVTVNSAIAIGSNALMNHTTGDGSVAIGASALTASTSGTNIAIGQLALTASTSSLGNVAIGSSSMAATVSGGSGVALGFNALQNNVSGAGNTAVGQAALEMTTGGNNTALGRGAGLNQTSGNNNITIGGGVFGVAGESGVIRIGDGTLATKTHIAGISGRVVPNGVPVLVDASHQLGVQVSSRRFKSDIAGMGDFSGRLAKLRPVTFRYTQPAADGSTPLDFGLIAEEVAEVFPELAVRSVDGQIETVAYHKLPALLLNELQKQQRVIDALLDRVHALESGREHR